jgi:alkanesulfonate monooxygenase SsuD/methylene tetrahydromethanopterin reductase-like flavin-dependent oxidoreductase (luciferase family)
MGEGRQLPGTAFAVRDPWPWPDFAQLVRDGESQGYRAVFLPEIAGRDAFAALTALAGETSVLRLGTGIVPIDTRALPVTAMAAATAHERSGGRFIVGLGTGPAVPGALDRLRVAVATLRRAFRGESVAIDGHEFTLSLALESEPAIWISALGPKAVALAGEVADGVLLNWCTPERAALARAQLTVGAERAGRDPADITEAAYIRASLGEDRPAATAALQEMAGQYAGYPAYARQFDSMGLGQEAAAAAEACRTGRFAEVPTELVNAVTLGGDVQEARLRLDAYRAAGVDLAVVYPVAAGADGLGSVRSTLTALAPGA